MTLYLLRYNNYYNRIALKENTLNDYLKINPETKEYAYLLGGKGLIDINFNSNDGISTSQVINNWHHDIPDYVVVTDSLGNIHSRWFVIECVKERVGKYTLSLKRDLIIDYYEAVIKAPIYLQKAMINTGSSLIFNSENMLFNQIKKDEIELSDETNTRWIVGYCANNAFDTYTPQEGNPISPGEIIAQPKLLAEDTELRYADILSYSQKGVSNNAANSSSVGFSIYHNYRKNIYDTTARKDNYDFENYFIDTEDLGDQGINYAQAVELSSSEMVQNQSYNIKQGLMKSVFTLTGDALRSAILQATGNIQTDVIDLSQANIDTLLANQNKTLRDPDGNIFVYSMTKKKSTTKDFVLTNTNGGNLYNAYTKFMEAANAQNVYYFYKGATYKDVGFTCNVTYEMYEITLSFSPEVGYKTSLKTNSRNLMDAPYKMFVIPYDKLYWANYEESETEGVPFNHISDPIACRAVAAQIAQNLSGSGALYDIQLLPYCPLRGFISDLLFPSGLPEAGPHMGVQLPYDPNNIIYSKIINNTGETDVVSGFVAFAEFDSFSFNIDKSITVPTNNVDFKVEHETSMYRLNGPNYNGSFEFKVTSNRGLRGFEVNCTYKPYQPYIHVNPIFNNNGLYGGDFNDARGLICSGDFSLPTITDSWKTYQIQNKAYSDSFNREIDNMDAVYKIERERQIISASLSGISSTIGAGIGAGIGLGNPLAGIGVAAGAGIANIVGASKDIEYSDRLHALSKDYKEDMFNLNLRNIQAKPYTLNKAGGININNKKYPFLEYYSATEEEKEALRRKIKYSSMTINVIGAIEDYKENEPTFIQGQCIRLENIDDDSHIATQIAYELNKGYYI